MEYPPDLINRLLIEKMAGTISAEDNALLETCIDNDPRVQQQWETLQQKLAKATARGFSLEGDTDTAWLKVAPPAIPAPHKKIRLFTVTFAAAVLLLALMAGAWWLSRDNRQPDNFFAALAADTSTHLFLQVADGSRVEPASAAAADISLGGEAAQFTSDSLNLRGHTGSTAVWSTVFVPRTGSYKVILPDGSQVWLNAQSKLRFPSFFNGAFREVYVTGEAFFHVTKNARQPFIVHTRQPDIRVLGTQFNVNTYDSSRVITSLVEGSVAASVRRQSVRLKPGFEALYASAGFTVRDFDSSNTLSWMQGVYYFHDTPLKDLAVLLPRWFNVQAHFENTALAEKVFSGALLKQQPLQSFLDNLYASDNIRAEIRDGVVYFR